MRKRFLAVIAVVPLWSLNAADIHAQGPHKLSVRQHPAISEQVTNTRVDEILQDMGTMLQSNCAVTFERFDDVAMFGPDFPFSINSAADFSGFAPKPGSVDVVGEINWCGGLAPNIIGCANRPGRALTVVRLSEGAEEPLLWAHEFAHTTGSSHREDIGALMAPVLGSSNTNVDATECNRLKAGSPAVHTDVEGSGIVDGPPSGASASESAVPPLGTPEPVVQFAKRIWVHGTPYELAKQYTDDDVTPLTDLLRDETQYNAWRHGVATLGAIGGERSKAVLLDFLLKEPDQKLTAEQYIAKSNVPVALGWLVRRSIEENKKDQATLELLIKMTNGDWWTQTGKIAWITAIHKNRESLITSLVTKAVIGLSLTGAPEAEARLKQMLTQTTLSAAVPTISADESAAVANMGTEAKSAVNTVSPMTKAAISRSGGDRFLTGQIGELQRVRENGLRAYYKR
ncbi:MAG: hypothetical protein JWR80_1368 [Bradyrhizobium sp.]|nr:hypothetical protein [Bradyrhizobium sp.]